MEGQSEPIATANLFELTHIFENIRKKHDQEFLWLAISSITIPLDITKKMMDRKCGVAV